MNDDGALSQSDKNDMGVYLEGGAKKVCGWMVMGEREKWRMTPSLGSKHL